MSKIKDALKANLFLIIIGIIIFTCVASHDDANSASTKSGVANEQTIGNLEIPAKIEGRKEQVIEHTGYTVSYNGDWRIPNWVAYELTDKEAEGDVPRHNKFAPDPLVASYETADTQDYTNSGFDRGHMAPAGDMKWSREAMVESFYLSNVCPQNQNLNRGIWNDLEQQVRDLAKQKGRIYVVCGPIVSNEPKTIGYHKVAVPDAFFKVLLQNVNGEYAAIAFMFPNKSGRKLLSTYAMSVDDIEGVTGIDFFPSLPDGIEEAVESQVDFTKWTVKRQK